MAGIIFVAGWIALAVFSGGEGADVAASVEPGPRQDDRATRTRLP
jgi:hypothetical protein